MATVYLHIGTMKTGTSAIQGFLDKNREVLKTKGYCFPRLRLGLDRNYFLRNGHFLVFRSKKDGEEGAAEEAAVRAEGFRMLEKLAKKYDNIVLSEEIIWHHCNNFENFWSNLREEFEKIGCELKVIVYLRRQDGVIQSLWNQFVKMGQMTYLEFDKWLEMKRHRFFPLDYNKHLRKIAKGVKRENLIVRVYERGQFEGEQHTIQSDFMKYINLPLTDEFESPNESRNSGLMGNYIEIKRLINGVPEYREMSDFMKKSLSRASNYQADIERPAKVSMFKYEDQLAFVERYEESNRKVAMEYFGREDGRLFYEPIEQLPVWEVQPETMYRDIVISMTEMMCEQEREIRKLQEQMNTLMPMKKLENSVRSSWFERIARKIRNLFKRDI